MALAAGAFDDMVDIRNRRRRQVQAVWFVALGKWLRRRVGCLRQSETPRDE